MLLLLIYTHQSELRISNTAVLYALYGCVTNEGPLATLHRVWWGQGGEFPFFTVYQELG